MSSANEQLLIQDFCAARNGIRPLTKILLANNGMAAVKAIRSIRKWSYETFQTEKAIHFTAMTTPEDLTMNAEYIRMADNFIEIPGGSGHNNYSNVDLIVDLAERTQADAVWVGWGFASENPLLGEKLKSIGVVFIGPPPQAMRSLGDKISSTIVAQSANVPCVNWSGQGLVFESNPGEFYEVPQSIYDKAMVTSLENGMAHAERIGFPVMIKASEGGGGKGIRLVYDAKDFKSAFAQVQREVVGSPIFVMQVVENARHLEVQLLADHYGNAIALFGRDCSVQRRHQKIIEEAPVTIAPAEILRDMEQSAVNLAKMVGYTSAGTVEYLYEPSTKKYYFLELNPRLQVEHPTTEMVSGVNLPAAQLQIAMGIPLSSIKDIRILYGLSPSGNSQIDFEFKNPKSRAIQRRPAARGHVIATRITAENPDAGFKPNSGRFLELNFKSNSNVWGYFSVNSAGGVHEYADSQFGHLFAYGESREDARKSLIMALKEISIRGDFRTTVQYLIKLLEHPIFESNRFSTSWLDQLIRTQAEQDFVGSAEDVIPALCGAAAKAFSFFEQRNKDFILELKKGKVPSEKLLQTESSVEFILNNIQYVTRVYITGPESFCVKLNNQSVDITAKSMIDNSLLLSFGGKSHVVYLKDEGVNTTLVVDSYSFTLENDHDPSQLRSPSPGKLVRYLCKDGELIKAGEAYAEIEVMKMYMPLVTKVSGIFTATKLVASNLSTGDIVGILRLDDHSVIKKAVTYSGTIPDFLDDASTVEDDKPHHKLRRLSGLIDNVLLGYEPMLPLKHLLQQFVDAQHDAELPIYEFAEALGSISSRIPQYLSEYLYQVVISKASLDYDQIESAIQESIDSLPLDDQDTAITVLKPMREVLDRYRRGLDYRAREVLMKILTSYHQLEMVFEKATPAKAVLELRESYRDDLVLVRDMVRANSKPKTRSTLICLMMNILGTEGYRQQSESSEIFEKLALLSSSGTQMVSLRAREILLRLQTPSVDHRRGVLLNIFEKALKNSEAGVRRNFDFSSLAKTISSRYSLLDILPELFFHPDTNIRAVALYVYVMRTNQAYVVKSFEHHFLNEDVILSWQFEHQNRNLFEPSGADLGTSDYAVNPEPGIVSVGIIFTCGELEDFVTQIKAMNPFLKLAESDSNFSINATVAIQTRQEFSQDDSASLTLELFVEKHREFLISLSVNSITFMFVNTNTHARFFTYKASSSFAEYAVIRHIEPFMSHRLEMERLANFDAKPTHMGQRGIQIFHAVGKQNPTDVRFFVRGIIHPSNVASFQDFFISEASSVCNGILDALEILSHRHPNTDCNHILIHFIPVFDITIEKVQFNFDKLLRLNGARLSKLRVNEVEVCYTGYHPESRMITPIRFVAILHSQYVIDISCYFQKKSEDGDILFSLTSICGKLHGKSVHRLHAPKESIQPKRYKAHLLGTTYIYDFPALFKEAIKQEWSKKKTLKPPPVFLDCTELTLTSAGLLEPSNRAPGANVCGMIVFKMKMYTPEYPLGRSVIVIGNDITYLMGSFGPTEDLIFLKASQLARSLGIPRIYLSANSGARIGLADEILSKYKIAWKSEFDCTKGFDFLYLEEEDYMQFSSKRSVEAYPTLLNGKIVYRLSAIIGLQHGLGVENLQGSGEIAGESSLAYKEIFTISLVTCRSVGIGAYLVRLGQRVIQVEYAPIILTGAAGNNYFDIALNKVLGSQVYSSNLQLGGTRIMNSNGVSHLTASNDFEGISLIIQWLGYIPERQGATLPIIRNEDPVDRKIEVKIPNGPYDPRSILSGIVDPNGCQLGGFFDKDSFQETLGGWAKGVVVGRARIGGIPVGAICVETRTTESLTYADPALESSQEEVIKEAGQVWYPNSASKTAQAIRDFNYGEELPMIIFANWRGFSGGQSDMSKEILKFGAQIVDALREFKQPIFIYIIGELRGGAWVVLDPSINSEMMEMYSYENGRGGVLEPQGIVEIKYRTPRVIATMERLDQECRKMKESMNVSNITDVEKSGIAEQLKTREKFLLPLYEQAAVEFADLHDRPARMLGKEVVRQVIPWESSREFFYWRIIRRLNTKNLIKRMNAAANLESRDAKDLINSWFKIEYPNGTDKEFAIWYSVASAAIQDRIHRLQQISIRDQISNLAKDSPAAFMEALETSFQSLTGKERQDILDRLSR